MDKTKAYNVNLCRICQSNSSEISSLIDISTLVDGGASFWDTLKYIFRDIVWIDDSLKSAVCKTCLKFIFDIAAFKTLCLETYDQRLYFQLKDNKDHLLKVNEQLNDHIEEIETLNDNLLGAAILPQWRTALKRHCNKVKVVNNDNLAEDSLHKVIKSNKITDIIPKAVRKINIEEKLKDQNENEINQVISSASSAAAILPQWPTEMGVKEILKDYNESEVNKINSTNVSVLHLEKNKRNVLNIKDKYDKEKENIENEICAYKIDKSTLQVKVQDKNVKFVKEKSNDIKQYKIIKNSSQDPILRIRCITTKVKDKIKSVDENISKVANAVDRKIYNDKSSGIMDINFTQMPTLSQCPSELIETVNSYNRKEKFNDNPQQYALVRLEKNINDDKDIKTPNPTRLLLTFKKISAGTENYDNKQTPNNINDTSTYEIIKATNEEKVDQTTKEEVPRANIEQLEDHPPLEETSKPSQHKRKRKDNLSETVRRTFSNDLITDYVDYMPAVDTNGFNCHICYKKFDLVEYLERHMCSEHNGERRYTCLVCKKKYITRSDLIVHSNRHFVKAYACAVCHNKRFKTVQELQRHNSMLRHSCV